MDRTAGTGPLGEDSWDRTSGTGLSGQDSLNRSARQAAWTGELGKGRDNRTPGHDSGVRRAVAKVASAGQLEQEDS